MVCLVNPSMKDSRRTKLVHARKRKSAVNSPTIDPSCCKPLKSVELLRRFGKIKCSFAVQATFAK